MTLAQRGVRSCTLRGNSCVQSTQCSGGAPRLRLLFLLACRRQGTVHTGARAFTAGTFHKLQGHFTNEATACGTLVIQGDTLPLRHGHSCFKGTFALRGVARWHSAPRYPTHSRRGPWGVGTWRPRCSRWRRGPVPLPALRGPGSLRNSSIQTENRRSALKADNTNRPKKAKKASKRGVHLMKIKKRKKERKKER